MYFKNFEITPLGNAKLDINPRGNLEVSNIGSSGLDGFMVNTENIDTYHIFFNELPGVSSGGSILYSNLGKNSFNQVSTTFENSNWLDPISNNVNIGFNMNLLPQQFTIFGELEGNRVFEIPKLNPIYPRMPQEPCTLAVLGLCVAVAAVAVSVWAVLRPTKAKQTKLIYDSEGKFMGTEITFIEDPVPFEIIVDGKTYTIDNFGITYDETTENPVCEDTILRDVAAKVTGVNLGTVEITDITRTI